MKKCNACQIEKKIEEFFKSSRSKDGLNTCCKSCTSIKSKKWRTSNPDKLKISWKKSRENKKQPDDVQRRKKVGLSKDEVNERNRIQYHIHKKEISEKRKIKIKTREFKDKAILRVRKYRENNREKFNEYQRRFKKRNPTYATACRKVSYALKNGKLIKPENCQNCGEKKSLQGHHEDYSKPLEIKWLCSKCHCREHDKLMDVPCHTHP